LAAGIDTAVAAAVAVAVGGMPAVAVADVVVGSHIAAAGEAELRLLVVVRRHRTSFGISDFLDRSGLSGRQW